MSEIVIFGDSYRRRILIRVTLLIIQNGLLSSCWRHCYFTHCSNECNYLVPGTSTSDI